MAGFATDERVELKLDDVWYQGRISVGKNLGGGMFYSDTPMIMNGKPIGTFIYIDNLAFEKQQGDLRKQKLPAKDVAMGELRAMPGATDYLQAQKRFGKGRTRSRRSRPTRGLGPRKTRRSRK
jgi:hypothetical protein